MVCAHATHHLHLVLVSTSPMHIHPTHAYTHIHARIYAAQRTMQFLFAFIRSMDYLYFALQRWLLRAPWRKRWRLRAQTLSTHFWFLTLDSLTAGNILSPLVCDFPQKVISSFDMLSALHCLSLSANYLFLPYVR